MPKPPTTPKPTTTPGPEASARTEAKAEAILLARSFVANAAKKYGVPAGEV
jgi:hypothetical protein